jgi:hypothetical protein
VGARVRGSVYHVDALVRVGVGLRGRGRSRGRGRTWGDDRKRVATSLAMSAQ